MTRSSQKTNNHEKAGRCFLRRPETIWQAELTPARKTGKAGVMKQSHRPFAIFRTGNWLSEAFLLPFFFALFNVAAPVAQLVVTGAVILKV